MTVASDHGQAEQPGKLQIGTIVRETTRGLFRWLAAIIAILIAALAGQFTSSWFIESGSFMNTDTHGPWRHWTTAGQKAPDPYTKARIINLGLLPLSTDIAGVFEADSDEDGARLHSSCDYIIEGTEPTGQWWSITVFDSSGALVTNDANRYAFTHDTAAIDPDGTYVITLGRDARPGNWLPTGGAGRLKLVFTVLDPATGLSPEQRADRFRHLPAIRSEGCS